MIIKTPRLERKVSPAATLRAMQGGSTMKIKTKHIKSVSVRSAAYRLEKHGYKFHVTEAGLIDETLVTCLKSPIK